MPTVSCPACRASLDVSRIAPGGKFACGCGQMMRLPPPPPARTILVIPDVPKAPPAGACPVCGSTDDRRIHEEISKPWGWACVAGGGVLSLIGLALCPLALAGVVLATVGGSLHQGVVRCERCRHAFSTGETRFGPLPKAALVALNVVRVLYLIFMAFVIAKLIFVG